ERRIPVETHVATQGVGQGVQGHGPAVDGPSPQQRRVTGGADRFGHGPPSLPGPPFRVCVPVPSLLERRNRNTNEPRRPISERNLFGVKGFRVQERVAAPAGAGTGPVTPRNALFEGLEELPPAGPGGLRPAGQNGGDGQSWLLLREHAGEDRRQVA